LKTSTRKAGGFVPNAGGNWGWNDWGFLTVAQPNIPDKYRGKTQLSEVSDSRRNLKKAVSMQTYCLFSELKYTLIANLCFHHKTSKNVNKYIEKSPLGLWSGV
jgi:hypothetical protein